MRQNEVRKEIWTIGHKCAILLFLLVSSTWTDLTATPWHLLFMLFYLSASFTVHIVRQAGMKTLFQLLSLLLIGVFGALRDPMYLLLLPAGLYEVAPNHASKNRFALILMLLPAAFLPTGMVPLYGLVALLSYGFCAMLEMYAVRIESYRSELARMRADVSRLTRSLDENNDFIRQSEYTYKLEERNRLSQEIHDKIGHAMTGALIQMEASKRLLASDPGKSAELLQNAIHISKDGIESIRQALKRMKPKAEQMGASRLRLFIEEFSATRDIRTVFTHEGNLELITPIQWKIMLDNTKEALTNAMKYSDATAVSVRLQVLNTLIKLEVSDNGKGTPKVIKGLGIAGMEERAAGINGKVIVDGSRGFSVTTLLPCER